jgi:hypothetical protein
MKDQNEMALQENQVAGKQVTSNQRTSSLKPEQVNRADRQLQDMLDDER